MYKKTIKKWAKHLRSKNTEKNDINQKFPIRNRGRSRLPKDSKAWKVLKIPKPTFTNPIKLCKVSISLQQ